MPNTQHLVKLMDKMVTRIYLYVSNLKVELFVVQFMLELAFWITQQEVKMGMEWKRSTTT